MPPESPPSSEPSAPLRYSTPLAAAVDHHRAGGLGSGLDIPEFLQRRRPNNR